MWVGILLSPSPQWNMCQHMGALPHVMHWVNSSPGMAFLGALTPAPVVLDPSHPLQLVYVWRGEKATGPQSFTY